MDHQRLVDTSSENLIRNAAQVCRRSFSGAQESLNGDRAAKSLGNQFDRFKIWAGNLGVFASGTASADHRLRDDPDIQEVLVGIMQRLTKELDGFGSSEAKNTSLTVELAQSEEVDTEELSAPSRSSSPSLVLSADSDDGSVPDDRLSGARLIGNQLVSIEELVGRLYRLSRAIRKPMNHINNTNITRFLKSNETARLSSEEVRSHVHWYSLFHFRHDPPEVPIPSVLVDRLADAAARRREKLLYRERHQRKLGQGVQLPASMAQVPPTPSQKNVPQNQPLPKESTAITQDTGQVRGSATTISISKTAALSATVASEINRPAPQSYARSVAISTISRTGIVRRDQLDIPDIPKSQKGAAEFICPYCHLVFSSSAMTKERWRRHVLKDLEPYVCLFEDCGKGDEMYDSVDEWYAHMQWSHTLVWNCQAPGHEEHLFPSQQEFISHMSEFHNGSYLESQLPTLVKQAAHPAPTTFIACPLCYEDLQVSPDNISTDRTIGSPNNAAMDHIASHLEAIALLSLPAYHGAESEASDNRSDRLAPNSRESIFSFSEDLQDNVYTADYSDDETPLLIEAAAFEWDTMVKVARRNFGRHSIDSQLDAETDLALQPFLLRAIRHWLNSIFSAEKLELISTPDLTSVASIFLDSQEYQFWRRNTRSLLWVSDPNNDLNTSISSNVVYTLREYEDSDSYSTVYFSFNLDSTDLTYYPMICALVTQLAKRDSTFYAMLQLYNTCAGGLRQPSLQELVDTLMFLLESPTPANIIIDSVDLCLDPASLVDLLKRISTYHSVRLLITSRQMPVSHLVEQSEWVIFNTNTWTSDGDIRQYIRHVFEKSGKLDIHAEVYQTIEDDMVIASNRSHPWVDLATPVVIKSLEDNMSRKVGVDEAQAIVGLLPRSVGGLYESIMKSVKPSDQLIGRAIFQLLLFGARQVTGFEIRAYASTSIGVILTAKPNDLVDIFSPLLKMSDRSNGHHIQLRDEAFKDYLSTYGQGQGANWWELEKSTSHLEIAKRCISYLLASLAWRGALAKDMNSAFESTVETWFRPSGVTSHELRSGIFLDYAAHYWSYHAQECRREDPELERLYMRLFDYSLPEFSAWCQIFDPDLELLEQSKDDKYKPARSRLYVAVQTGFTPLVRKLLQAGQDMDRGMGPLGNATQVAAVYNRLDILELLYDQKLNDLNERGGTYDSALYGAVSHKCLDAVKFLLEHGADPNLPSPGHPSILLKALDPANTEILRQLLIHDTKEQDNDFTLWYAASGGCTSACRLLVEYGHDINYWQLGTGSALHAAAESGHLDTVNELLKLGANVNSNDNRGNSYLTRTSNLKEFRGATPLHRAVGMGHTAIVERLLVMGAEVNIQDTDFETPLFMAAERGHVDIINLLIKHGADLEKRASNGNTPMFSAARHKHATAVELLLNSGAALETNAVRPYSALYSAVLGGNISIVRYLLDHGANIETRNYLQRTAVFAVRGQKHANILELLVHRGADINAQDRDGNTVLHYSTFQDRFTKTLLKAGANPNIQNKNGETALTLSYNSSAKNMATLIEHGANLQDAGLDWNDALLFAVEGDQQEMTLTLLINKPPPPPPSSSSDETSAPPPPRQEDITMNKALSHAVSQGLVFISLYLLEHGADANFQDPQGQSLLHAALKLSQPSKSSIIRLLLEHEADPLRPDLSGISPMSIVEGYDDDGEVLALFKTR